ncbi:hypothetical protein SODG_001929 [Sodalis praecaptivus]
MFKYLASTPETKAIRSALAIALGKPDHGGAYARMLTEFVTAHADRFNAWLDTEAILAKAAREGANAPCRRGHTRVTPCFQHLRVRASRQAIACVMGTLCRSRPLPSRRLLPSARRHAPRLR